MSVNEPVKISEAEYGVPVYDESENEWYIERYKNIRYLNPLTKQESQKRVPLPRVKLAEHEGLTKKARITVIFIRAVLDRESLRHIKGFFKQEIEISVGRNYKHRWLKIVDGTVVINDLSQRGFATIVGINEVLKEKQGFTPNAKVRRKGNAKRLKAEEIMPLFQEQTTSKTLFEEDPHDLSLRVVGRCIKKRKIWRLQGYLFKYKR